MAEFTVGQDCQVVITGPFGEIELDLQTRFDVKQSISKPEVKVIDGTRKSRLVFDCWTGTFNFARQGPALDQLAQAIQQYSLAGTPIPNGSIYYTVNEPDGSISAWQLNSVTMWPADLGGYAADAATMQSIGFQAETREAA